MSVTMPKFIEEANISESPIIHTWDDANPLNAFYREDARLGHRIAETSRRGVLALSAAFAEWVAWRLQKQVKDPILFQRIEAIWASIIDWQYLRPFGKLKRAEWNGVIGGPIWAASNLLKNTQKIISQDQFAWPESVCLSYLVLHVLPNPEPFKEWRRFAIKRLAITYPRNPDDLLGVPVPREALDPEVDYKPEMAKELLENFLSQLNPSENPYLNSAEEMVASGFKGTPYTLL